MQARGHALTLPDGEPFEIEFLDFENFQEPRTTPFIKELKFSALKPSIALSMRAIKRRLNDFDYDVVTARFGLA